MSAGPAGSFASRLLSRTWLSSSAFEITLERPAGFTFEPGQCIRLVEGAEEREYSLTNAPCEPRLSLCVRQVDHGHVSGLLASAEPGRLFACHGPHGYFVFRDSPRPAVFVATGTGVAPFVSMARAGVSGFTLLHGVQRPEDLYFEAELRRAAGCYVACVSRSPGAGHFPGRVTAWAAGSLPPQPHDFYLCGNRDMIRDCTILADTRFPGSFVSTEVFH